MRCPSSFVNEGDLREPVHVHVSRPGGKAKLWLSPTVREAYNQGLDQRTMRLAIQIATEHQQELIGAWNDFFSGTG